MFCVWFFPLQKTHPPGGVGVLEVDAVGPLSCVLLVCRQMCWQHGVCCAGGVVVVTLMEFEAISGV